VLEWQRIIEEEGYSIAKAEIYEDFALNAALIARSICSTNEGTSATSITATALRPLTNHHRVYRVQ